ncbi:MAG TPA: DUF2304 domain-containing protein [Candidatus Ozemobacteraceae bacterium]|nr:MAG: hypothetical protein BWY66_00194 [bacterium ADurb.Bin374]HOT26807.1 DUF2304 domain-containing protein [Candidatus Ozemobacteraceae bacterium]
MSDQFEETRLPPRQKAWVVTLSCSILYLTLDLVRRRRFREDDSWLWLLVGIITFVLGLHYRLLKRISSLLGIVAPTSTIFFFGQLFLMLLALQSSLRHAALTRAIQVLAQEHSLHLATHHRKQAPGTGRNP